MPKRKYNNQFDDSNVKKHTLDSDEEDYVDETNVLDENDIEGEEDGHARQDGEQKMTAFNMREELEEGHFDRDGHFIWDNEKEVRDNWLDNIDWQKIKHTDTSKKYKIQDGGLGDDSSDSDDNDSSFNELDIYSKIIGYMKPKESINKALKRLGGDLGKLSSVERLKRKKAGTLPGSEDVSKLTELANQILTKLGNMDIYQETYEQIEKKLAASNAKSNKAAAELDMYSDDFEANEKNKLKDELPSQSSSTIPSEQSITEDASPSELKWEYKWSVEDDKIEGPYTTRQMIKWQKDNHFKPGVMVRKCGEKSNFYSLSRIDFELYE